MNIILIYSDKFPIGGAGANRHLSIAKGQKLLNNIYTVYIIRPTEDSGLVINKNVSGVFDSVNYEFTSGSVIWSPRFMLSKIFLYIKGIIVSIWRINKCLEKDKKYFVISAFSSYWINMIYYLYCKIKNIKYLYIIDEYPWRIIFPQSYNKFITYVYLRTFYKYFDGIIVMTEILMNYYQKLVKKKAKLFLMPMTVDVSRFINLKEIKKDTFDIMYCGSMDLYKDGIHILAEAFCRFVKHYPNSRLILIGSLKNDKGIGLLKELILKHDCNEKVIFRGEIDRSKIPQTLFNADILALARPKNKQAEGGFPTKLGEYLMTGKPVVVTKVGEIGNYLKHKIHAYIAEPDSVDSIERQFIEIVNNKEESKIIGLNGKMLAIDMFDSYKQSVRLNHFLLNNF